MIDVKIVVVVLLYMLLECENVWIVLFVMWWMGVNGLVDVCVVYVFFIVFG